MNSQKKFHVLAWRKKTVLSQKTLISCSIKTLRFWFIITTTNVYIEIEEKTPPIIIMKSCCTFYQKVFSLIRFFALIQWFKMLTSLQIANFSLALTKLLKTRTINRNNTQLSYTLSTEMCFFLLFCCASNDFENKAMEWNGRKGKRGESPCTTHNSPIELKLLLVHNVKMKRIIHLLPSFDTRKKNYI